jgi:HK97 family phage prohead protease
MRRVDLPNAVRQIRDRQVRAVISSGQGGRDGVILDCNGADLAQYRKNPVVLAFHDPNAPIGRCSTIARNGNGAIEGLIDFAKSGISPMADQVYGLIKDGVISALSVGYEPKSPPGPKDKNGFRTVKDWELLELSFVSIPADPGAVVLERAHWRRREHLGPPVPLADLGHRLNDVEALAPRRVRAVIAEGLRHGVSVRPDEVPPQKPVWDGSSDAGTWARRCWHYQWQRQQRSAGL